MDGWMDCFVVGESGREVDKTDSGCLTIGQVQEKKKYTTTRRAAAKEEEEEEEEEENEKTARDKLWGRTAERRTTKAL
jgi:hypothetical protein